MLLVCGGLSRAVKPVKITEDVTSFPIVVALVSDGDEHKLPAIMANINEPFVVRLLDKDLIKIVESDAWKNAMRRERGE